MLLLSRRAAFVAAAGTLASIIGFTLNCNNNILKDFEHNRIDGSLQMITERKHPKAHQLVSESLCFKVGSPEEETNDVRNIWNIDTGMVPIPLKTNTFHQPPKGVDDPKGFYDDNDTVFGLVLRGKLPASILAESDNLLAFQDRTPRGPIHALVIPKRHIPSVLNLTPSDLPMLYEMKSMAKKIVKQHYPGYGLDSFRMVFHIPPFFSVPHLHLHVIGPVSKMEWFYRQWKYPRTEARWCTQLNNVIRRIEQNKKPVPYNILHYPYTTW